MLIDHTPIPVSPISPHTPQTLLSDLLRTSSQTPQASPRKYEPARLCTLQTPRSQDPPRQRPDIRVGHYHIHTDIHPERRLDERDDPLCLFLTHDDEIIILLVLDLFDCTMTQVIGR
jgi:hypothetical protein